jgi:hypothetical protein
MADGEERGLGELLEDEELNDILIKLIKWILLHIINTNV